MEEFKLPDSVFLQWDDIIIIIIMQNARRTWTRALHFFPFPTKLLKFQIWERLVLGSAGLAGSLHFCRNWITFVARQKTESVWRHSESKECRIPDTVACLQILWLKSAWSTYKTSYKDNTRCLEAPRSGLNSGFVPCSSSGSAYYRILIKQLKHLHFGNHFCLFCIFPHSSFWCSKQEFQANLVLIWGCIPWDGNYLIIATANKIYTQLQKQNKTLQIFWQLVLLMIIICAVNVGMKRKL